MPGLGWLPDPAKEPDEKPDWDAGELLGAATYPLEHSAARLIRSILNQGPLSSCVANAGFQAIRADHVRQGIENPILGSRQFGYHLARAIHGATLEDRGTYIRLFFEALNKFGFPPEEAWPYLFDTIKGKPRWATMPSTDAFRLAFDQKSPVAYRRIFETGTARVDAVKRAISNDRCVVFGTHITDDFVRSILDFTKPISPPESDEPIAGGHAMVLCRYTANSIGGPNSWGETWGADGWFDMAPEYIAWDGSKDFWIVENSPKYVAPQEATA